MTFGPPWIINAVSAAAFYFLLFAPRDVRRGLFRRQGPKDEYWIPAVAVAAAVAWFVQVRFALNLETVAVGAIGSALVARGGYLLWRQWPVDWGTATPAAESSDAEAPRLSIAHLLGLAVWLAILFGVLQSCGWDVPGLLRSDAEGKSASHVILGQVTITVWTVWMATTLAGLGLLIERRWRGQAYPVHPGEYLWILLAFRCACGVFPWALVVPYLSVPLLPSLLMRGFGGALDLWAWIRMDRRRWRVYLGVWIACELATTVGMPHIYAATPRQALVILSLLVPLGLVWPLWLDSREGVRRPWSHWAGVLLWLASAVFVLIGIMFTWLS